MIDVKKNYKRAFSINEAAEYACVSRATMQNWIASRWVPFEELPGRGEGSRKFRLIRKLDLDLFLNKHYQDVRHKYQESIQDKLVLLPQET